MRILLYWLSLMTILTGLLAQGGCGGRIDDTEESIRMVNDIGIWYLIGTWEKYSLADNQNGTVSLLKKDFFGKVTGQQIYKKCLQGQLYRPLPDNDCRGIGTLADHWGAALLQYCNANVFECYPDASTVPNSEIYTSCANDTTAGLNWYPYFDGFVDYKLFNTDYVKNFSSFFPDIPPNSGIWTAFDAYQKPDMAVYIIFPYDGERYSLKTSKKFTLCGNQFR